MSFIVGQEVEVVDTDIAKFLSESNYPVTGKLVEGFIISRILTELVEFTNDKGESLRLALKPEQLKLANTFNSQQEIWEYLVAGGKVVTNNPKNVYAFVDGATKCIVSTPRGVSGTNISMTFYNYQDFSKYTEPKVVNWYDNIPESGILCWVYDNESQIEDKITGLITKYTKGNFEPFTEIDGKTSWRHATPATQEEVDALIYKAN